jgi:hypothetical protein
LLPPTGGRGVGMAPSLTGRGWGWVVFFAAEAVSRFPGPPLEDPPTSPPHKLTGARGGSAVGRLAHGLPPPRGRRSVAADVPARLAQRLQRSRPKDHEWRRLCGRRATKGAEGERLARRSSRCEHFDAFGLQRPGSGLGGWPGWRSGRRRTERSAAQRPASRSVRQAGLVHAQREGIWARDPRTREGPPRVSAGNAGLTVSRQGWRPVRGETPVPRWLDAQRDSPAPRSGEAPRPIET